VRARPRAPGGRRAAWAVCAAAAASAGAASGQAIDVERPRTLVIGSPRGGSREDRVDAARTGCARTALPTSGLRIEWEASIGALTEQAPLVDSPGNVYVVGSRGEVVALSREGVEQWRVSAGGAQPGPAALLADDTVVFAETTAAGGAAVGVRDGRVRWRAHLGSRGDPAPAAPLPLDDGGVVVTAAGELIVLDADGHERARASVREPVAAPLLSALGKVIAVTASGVVWTWSPGTDPTRVAGFGSSIDGSAGLADDHTLLAVTTGRTHLTAVDLGLGTVTTRAVSPGATWCGPPVISGSATLLVAVTPGRDFAIALDPAGREVARAVLGVRRGTAGADAGATTLVSGQITPPLVDAGGTFVFATADGRLGVVPKMAAGEATVELVSTMCPPSLGAAGSRGTSPIAGLAPLTEGSFVATCRSGAVLAVGGPSVGGPAGGPRWSGESRPQRL